MAILAVERLDLLATIREIEAPVREHSIHIEDNHRDLSCLFVYVLHFAIG